MYKKHSKVCEKCGKVFETYNIHGKYCTRQCANEAIGYKRRRYIKCLNCNKKIWANGKVNQYFCSAECMYEYMDKNRKHPKRNAPPIDGIYHRECAFCGKHFDTKNGKIKYCSYACKSKGMKDNEKKRKEKNYKSESRICKGCGVIFYTSIERNNNSLFCSENCKKEYYKNERDDIKKIMKIMGIDIKYIHKRDKGICQICGLPVEIESKDEMLSATIDHKTPISKGGASTEENCQLAHRYCNLIKHNRGGEFKIDWEELVRKNSKYSKVYKRLKNIAEVE